MATVYGTNATNRDVTIPAVKNKSKDERGRLFCAYDTYVAAAAIPISTIINLMKLPPGARVHEVILDSDDLGTVGTISVGWAANGVDSVNATGFLTAQDVHTAAATFRMTGLVAPAGHFKEFTVETQVTATAAAATDVAGTFRVAVWYGLDW